MAGELSLKTPLTGLVTLVPTNTATDKTITLPATTGTMVVQDGTNTTTVTNLAYTGTLTGGTGVVNLGSGQVYKDASGNVGIGTASPGGKLDVFTSAAANVALFRAGAGQNSFVSVVGNGNTFLSTSFDIIQDTNNLATVVNRANGALAFGTNNTERMRIEAGGNVGIGTISPNQRLQVTGSNGTGFAGATLQNSNANVGLAGVQFSSDTTYSKSAIAQVRENANGNGPLVFYVDSATDAADWAAGDEKMRISAAGNVGIGTASPTSTLTVQGTPNGGTVSFKHAGTNSFGTILTLETIGGTDDPVLSFKNYNGGSPVYYGIVGTDDGALGFRSNASTGSFGDERMRLTSSGDLLVGTSGFVAGQNAKHIAPSVILSSVNSTASSGQIVFYNPNGAVGQIYTDGATTVFATSSDYRLKEITGVVTATEAKDFIMALQPKQGTWKVDGSKFVGFLAHEFKNVSPSSVFGEKDAVDKDGKPVYQGMQAASSEVMANLIALVQELTARLEVLENK